MFNYFKQNQSQYQILLNNNNASLSRLAETFPEPYRSEIRGMSDATGIGVEDFMLLNVFYELSSSCSAIVAKNIQGEIFLARNLDFGLLLGWDFKNDVFFLLNLKSLIIKKKQTWMTTQLLRKITINLFFYKKKQLLFKSTALVGYVGILTGLKPVCVLLQFY